MRWKYLGPGTWETTDGRFSIVPEYFGTTRPQSYRLHDNTNKTKCSADTVATAKWEARDILLKERES